MRRSLQLALFAIVLAGLVSGTVAWASFSKTVTLSVDGVATSVDTRSGDVQGVLADAGIDVAEHDVLAPPAEAAVADGGEIVLNRGRLLTLTIDGTERQIWVTARSVDEALTQLGYRDDDIYVSASRSTRLPLTGYALAVRMPKTVTILVDGDTRTVTTTVPDVNALVAEQDIVLATTDRLSMVGAQPLLESMVLTVTRIRYEQVQVTKAIAHKRVERADDQLYEGESEVRTAGVDGAQVLTFRVTKTDGKETAREQVSAKVTRQPVDEVVAVGTRVRPVEPAPSTPSPGGGGGGGGASPPPSSSGLNWDALAQCESGGNWAIASGNGYYGGLQFDKGTWDAYGGGQYAAYPNQASRSQQIAVGEALYADRGDSPWPACGYHLYD